MKLYYANGTCALSPHIVLLETGLKFETERVDIRAHKTASGGDYYAINPKGYVPALQLDDGSILTEGPAIVQYLADQKPETKLAPPNGTIARYRLQEWLTFIGTEIHKAFSPLFNPAFPDDQRKANIERIGRRFDFVAKGLEGKKYLLGDDFTAADAYLFVTLNWSQKMAPEGLARNPNLKEYFERVLARPSVKAALEAERANL